MEPVSPRLVALAMAYFRENDIEAEPAGDSVVTARGIYGLVNLSQYLRTVPPAGWDEYVRNHFDRLAGIEINIPATFDEARHRLRIRLCAPGDVHTAHVRPVNAGLNQMLMLKIPEGGISVPEGACDRWGVPESVAWSQAVARTRWDEPHEVSLLRSPRGATFTRVEGSFWSSSLLVDLEPTVPAAAASGALAIVPCHDLLIVTTLTANPPWADLLSLASAIYELGPGSVSPDIFWWSNGVVERVVEFTDRGPIPRWGVRFRAVMDGLDRYPADSRRNSAGG